MTTRFDFVYLGEIEFSSEGLTFFGDIFVYYLNLHHWSIKEFSGSLTVNERRYRGKWTKGRRFKELEYLFLSNPQLVDVAKDCIRRRLEW